MNELMAQRMKTERKFLIRKGADQDHLIQHTNIYFKLYLCRVLANYAERWWSWFISQGRPTSITTTPKH